MKFSYAVTVSLSWSRILSWYSAGWIINTEGHSTCIPA